MNLKSSVISALLTPSLLLAGCGFGNTVKITPVGETEGRQDDSANKAGFPERDPDQLVIVAFDELMRFRRSAIKMLDSTPAGREGCITYRPHRVGRNFLRGTWTCSWQEMLLKQTRGMNWAVSGAETFSETKTTGEAPIRESNAQLKIKGTWAGASKAALEAGLARKVRMEVPSSEAMLDSLDQGASLPFENEAVLGSETSGKNEWWKVESTGQWKKADGSLVLEKGAVVTLTYRPAGNVEKTSATQLVFTAEDDVAFANGCPRPIGKFTLVRATLGSSGAEVEAAEDAATPVTTTQDEIETASGKIPWSKSCLESAN